MTTPANTVSTYDAIGNREDLSDIIYDISPTSTPFISGIAHTSATATNHEWQTDTLGTAANNAVIEGGDAATTAAIATVRLGNRTQISSKVPRVTRTQRRIDSAGRGDEMSLQIMKMGKLLKNDMVGSTIKQALSGIVNGGSAGAAQRVVDGNAATVHTAIDIYVSDFGSLAVVPNRFMVQDSLLVLQMDMFAMASVTDFEETPLAKTGDSDRVQILSEYTLESRNEKASGIVADLTA